MSIQFWVADKENKKSLSLSKQYFLEECKILYMMLLCKGPYFKVRLSLGI